MDKKQTIDLKKVQEQYPESKEYRFEKNPLKYGDKINKWTVLYKTSACGTKHAYYVCQCDCGYIAPVQKSRLIKNETKGCKNCKNENLVGKTYGKLQVLYKTDNKNAKGYWYWHCKCDCGNECEVDTNSLKTGHTQSCGCLHKEKMNQKRLDLTGQRFGKLIALYPIVSNKGDKQTYWHCKCDCGNECNVQTGHLRQSLTRSCGCTKSFQEENIAKLLTENNIPFIYQYSFNNFQHYKFDFYVNNSYIIEFDGKQHFIWFENSWNNKDNVKATHNRDLLKNEYCFKNNIPIIRIPYDKNYNLQDLLLETTSFLLTPDNENIYYQERLKI